MSRDADPMPNATSPPGYWPLVPGAVLWAAGLAGLHPDLELDEPGLALLFIGPHALAFGVVAESTRVRTTAAVGSLAGAAVVTGLTWADHLTRAVEIHRGTSVSNGLQMVVTCLLSYVAVVTTMFVVSRTPPRRHP